MNKFSVISLLIAFIFLISFQSETSAQIQDIKKKSNDNKSNSSSRSSSSSSNDNDNCVSGCIGSIIGELFDGCLTAIFSGNGNDKNDSYADNYSEDNNPFPLVENQVNQNIIDNNTGFEEEALIKDSIKLANNNANHLNEKKISDKQENESISNKQEDFNQEINKNNENLVNKKVKPNHYDVRYEKDISLDINANFAVALHKGIDKMYTYIDYLPGLRANFNIFMIDFRYNILTEYTNGYPDSFTSLELLFMANLTANQPFKIIIGTGIQREDFSQINFNEFYFGTKIPMNRGGDFLEADTRFSIDFETKAYPFFEIGGRYQKKIMNFSHLTGYISLGASYQNYYQSQDIWAINGGIIINLH